MLTPVIDRDLPHRSLFGRLPRSTVTPPPSQGSYMDIALTCSCVLPVASDVPLCCHKVQVHNWGSTRGQTRRFEVLLDLLGGPHALRKASLADVGCGCGDFAAFLKDSGARPREYVGYDIVSSMVAAGMERFAADGSTNHRFEARDISLSPPDRKFDFVISSGVFAFGNTVSTADVLFSSTRRGIFRPFLRW